MLFLSMPPSERIANALAGRGVLPILASPALAIALQRRAGLRMVSMGPICRVQVYACE